MVNEKTSRKRTKLKTICKRVICMLTAVALIAGIAPVAVEPEVAEADVKPSKTVECTSHSWTYHWDANKHHHKHCYDCGKNDYYSECTPKWVADDLTGHYAVCKICKQRMTPKIPHDRNSTKNMVINGVSHSVPCCSVCGFVERNISGDGCDFEVKEDKDKNGCCAVCKKCGAYSPYYKWSSHNPYFHGGYDDELVQIYNRTQHWTVCKICGTESKRQGHDFRTRQLTQFGVPVYDMYMDPVMENYDCKLCGYDKDTYKGMSHNVQAHKHKWEWKSVGSGYQRQFCSVCGASNGKSTKCTKIKLVQDEKTHYWTCSECGEKWGGYHNFEGVGSASTQEKCMGKCTVCGYEGEYITYADLAGDNYQVGAIGEHVYEQDCTPCGENQHKKKCLNCDFELVEDCDFKDTCYFEPATSTKRHHKRVCRKCGNKTAYEECSEFKYEQYTVEQHLKICKDCENKRRERHDWVVRDYNDDTHTRHCNDCHQTLKEERHHMITEKYGRIPNSILGNGGYWTRKKCANCPYFEKASETWHSTQKQPDPPKQKNFDQERVKVNKPTYHTKNKGAGTGSGGVTINSNLLSGAPVSDGIVDYMGEHPEEFLDENFDLEQEITKAKEENKLPEKAKAYTATLDEQSGKIQEEGNTKIAINPMINLEVLEYDADNKPDEIKYRISAFYYISLEYVPEGVSPDDEENIVTVNVAQKDMDADFAINLTVPVPNGFTQYDRTVMVTQEKNDETHTYFGTVDTDGYYAEWTVSFVSEAGLGDFTLKATDHKITHVDRVEPTRAKDGNIEYYACTVCNKYFTDMWCTDEIPKDKVKINKYPDKEYVVSYGANGGTGEMDSFSVDAGTVIILPECRFEPPAGKKFDFWNWKASADSGDQSYSVFAGDKLTVAGDIVIWPEWIDENAQVSDTRECTITFDKAVTDEAAAEVQGTMEPQVFQRGVPKELNANKFTRKGYKFYGWSYNGSSNSATLITDKQSKAFYRDQTLIAVWQKVNTTTFDKNAEDAVGEMEPQQQGNSVYVYLDKNKFTREGYQFVGWAESPDATIAKYLDQAYTFFSSDHTLYAVWKKTCKVTFDKNAEDAVGTMEEQNVPQDTYSKLNPNKFKREGYVFGGWMKKADGTSRDFADASTIAKFSEDTTLYALWYKENNIYFSANGGEGEMEPQTVVTKTSTKVNKCTFTKEGYYFAGWGTKEDATLVSCADEGNAYLSADGDVIYYAIWRKDVAITFDPNADDAEGTMEPQMTTNNTYTTLNENAYTREGYEFAGWANNPDATSKDYKDKYTAFLTDEDTVLYAVWKKPITITFDANGGEGEMDAQETTNDTYFKLNSNAFTREGYTFSGWATSPTDNNARYTNSYYYAYFKEDTTLYAVWHKNVKANFDANGGKGTMTYQQMTDKTYTALKDNKFTRTGYTFMGWSTSPNATYASKGDGQFVYLTEDTTFYAVWRPDTTSAVEETVSKAVSEVGDANPAELSEAEKENADEAVDKAAESLLILKSMEDADIAKSLMNSEENLEALEKASQKFGSTAIESEGGADLKIDAQAAPDEAFYQTDSIKVTNALLNAFLYGANDENAKTDDDKVALTFTIGAANAEVDHEVDETAYDADNAVTFSMHLDNVGTILSGETRVYAVPIIVTLPIPEKLRGVEELTLLHYDPTGKVKETIVPRINETGDLATFVISDCSDFALVGENKGTSESTAPPMASPTPTASPTSTPTATPTVTPTSAPTASPTSTPVATSVPTIIPGSRPTTAPTVAPTIAPTVVPTEAPTVAPTTVPTSAPPNKAAAEGTTLRDASNARYIVTSKAGAQPEVKYVGPQDANSKKVTIPATITVNGITYKVTAVAAGAFKNNKKLQSVTIGSNVTTIEKDAFAGCSSLKVVTIGSSVTSIGDNAFANCKSLTKIIVGAKVVKIGNKAFANNAKLKYLVIKTKKLKQKNLKKQAFSGITKKTRVYVPKKKKKNYKKVFRKRGLSKKVKIK